MAKKSTEDILDEIGAEADAARSDMGSAKSGLVRPGEESTVVDESDEDEFEQNLDTDEDSDEEDDPDEDQEDDEGDEEDAGEDEDEDDSSKRFNPNAARRIQAKKDETIAELQAKISEFENAKTETTRKSVEDRIGVLAGELGLDSTGLSKIANEILAITEERIASKLPVADLAADYESRQEEAHFNSEWKNFAPDFSKEYPRMSAIQLENAKQLMDDLSHDPDLGGVKITGKDGKPRLQPYPLDYIFFRNKRDFDRILSPGRRRGLESSNNSTFDIDDGEDSPDLSTRRGIDAADKKYRDAETQSSGLRRGRSPKNRSI